MAVHVVLCSCRDRVDLTHIGLFVFWPQRDGWVFTTDPLITFVECPFCDQLLPATSAVQEHIKDEQRRELERRAEGETGG